MYYDYLIIGGGVLGQAVAWELANRIKGQGSIGLVTSEGLSNGTTAQAAALVTQGRSSVAAARLVQETLSAVAHLNEELELGVPFHKAGGLHVAMSKEEHDGLQTMAAVAEQASVSHKWLSKQAVQEKAPEFNLSGFYSALWFAEDGYIDPVLLANAYGESAKAKGVRFHLQTKVASLLTEDCITGEQRLNGIRLMSGDTIQAKHVILCAGPWAAKLLKPLACSLPVSPVRSLYWMTEALPSNPRLPVTIVPSVRSYFRKENQSILFGVRDCPGQSLHPDHIPDDVLGFAFPEDENGLDALVDTWPKLVSFWPQIERLGLAHFISGISSYSLDGLPIIGDPIFNAKTLKGLTVVSGCSGAGVAYSGGIAKIAVDHAVNGIELETFRSTRFSNPSPLAHPHFVTTSNERSLTSNEQTCAYNMAFRQRCLQARYNKKAG